MSARKHIAQWIVNEAPAACFMVGVIEKSNPIQSFKTSCPPLAYFCDPRGGFEFNIKTVRHAASILADYDWKKNIAPAIHLFDKYKWGCTGEKEAARKKLFAAIGGTPVLSDILTKLLIRPGSGEYTILSWLNIDR